MPRLTFRARLIRGHNPLEIIFGEIMLTDAQLKALAKEYVKLRVQDAHRRDINATSFKFKGEDISFESIVLNETAATDIIKRLLLNIKETQHETNGD